MKWIRKTSEPRELTEWRSKYNTDINFGYSLLRQDSAVVTALVALLLKEQGWICAYTGIGIDENRCHIEHVKPQEHCSAGETVAYSNVVACYPAPNPKRKTPYGAEQKGNWPCNKDGHLFVSPLDPASENRFKFNLRGKISAAKSNDAAAKETIKQLGLNHPRLIDLRDGAIKGTLGVKNNISIKDARKRLRSLQAKKGDRLDPFWFVLIQALEKHINRLEYTKKSKAKASGKLKR